MSSETISPETGAAETTQPVFLIQNIYLKDLSLEQPNSPAIFLEQQMPELEIAINIGAEQLAETIFESQVTATVTARIGEKVAYLIEGKQAGIFEVHHVPAEAIDQIISISCPNIIYPYLRAHIADIVLKAGFPAVHLSEISFEALYHQRLQEQATEEAENKTH